MGQSPDQIRREIDQSRDSAASKIDQLQSQVQDTAQGVRDSVQETAQNVQATAETVVEDLKGTVSDTVETVRQSLDLREQITQRPLLSLGVALIGGFVLGGITGHDDRQPSRTYSYWQPEHGGPAPSGSYQGGNSHSSAVTQGIRAAVQKTGLEDTISNAAAALIGSVTDQVKSTLDQNFPGFADKMTTAQSSSGGFAEKAKHAQESSSV